MQVRLLWSWHGMTDDACFLVAILFISRKLVSDDGQVKKALHQDLGFRPVLWSVDLPVKLNCAALFAHKSTLAAVDIQLEANLLVRALVNNLDGVRVADSHLHSPSYGGHPVRSFAGIPAFASAFQVATIEQ